MTTMPYWLKRAIEIVIILAGVLIELELVRPK
jgi:hypothetical protein